MEAIGTTLSSKDAKQTFIALAHRIKLNEADWKKKYLISLVETAFLYKDDHCFNSLAEVQGFIKSEEITSFEIYEYELKNAIDELEEKAFLLKTFNGWKLAQNRKRELERVTNEWLNLEQRVKEDWLNNISTKYPNLQQNEKILLWTNLIEKFVVKIFLRHGAETSKLIFGYSIPDEDKFLESLYGILENATYELPLPYLREIAKNEYPLFFEPANSARRQYLMGLLDAALSQFAMAIPEESLQSICNIMSIEIKLFLDTNFLFSAIGLSENHLNESVREVLKLQQTISKTSGGKIKIKFFYSSDTLKEFRKAIDTSVLRLSDTQVNRSIAKAVVISERLSGLDLAYFKKLAESNIPISPEEYYKAYRNGAERLLKNEGIELYNSTDIVLDNIKYKQEVIDDIHDFNDYLKAKEKERKWETIEHDVILWHYIKNLKEYLTPTSLSTAPLLPRFFILTLDYRFLSFDRHKFKGENVNPICLLPTQFLQMLSLFIPRTEDFEKAFIALIKTPMARTVDPETERTSLNILKALSVYEDFSEDIAVELLLDETLQIEVKNIKDPGVIRKLIEDKLSIELETQRQRYQKFQEEKRIQEEKMAEKDAQISQLEDKLVRYEKRIRELEEFQSEVENKKQIENKEQNKGLEEDKGHKLKSLSKFITKLFSFFAWLANFIKNLWELKSKLGL